MSSRLTQKQKLELLKAFSLGVSASSLAERYGCSPNTVIRTVKALLPPDEYTALKTARSKGAFSKSVDHADSHSSEQSKQEKLDNQDHLAEKHEETLEDESDQLSQLALEDADDFSEEIEDNLEIDFTGDSFNEVFHEIAPLPTDLPLNVDIRPPVSCEPFSTSILPGSVFMVVDKSVELEVLPLKEFPELGSLTETDQDLLAISLFSNQRSAKRRCGRNQRVIKIPDTNIFEVSIPFLISRGITRIVLEGTLISLD